MTEPRRLLITGSREWRDEDTMRMALFAAWTRLSHEWIDGVRQDVVLVHGAARGADTMAASIWASQGLLVEPHALTSADWVANPRIAGHLRNQKMVDLGAVECLAFFASVGENRGTSDCARRAHAAGIKVVPITERIPAGTPEWGRDAVQ